MPRLLVAGKLHPSGVALLDSLRTRGVTVDYVEDISEASFVPLIPKADALVLRTQPLTADTIAKAHRLKVVSRHGVGYDAVDVAALNARGIALTIVGNVNAVSVAEHAMMLILAAAKRLLRADHAVRDPTAWAWRNRLEQQEISGKSLLIIGFGRTGRELARMSAAFRMNVRAYDPLLQNAGWPDGPVDPVQDLREGLAESDFVSVHVPKTDEPVLGAAEIAAMKPGAILVNTARGGVVCEMALADALADGRIAAAGTDVFETEPPDPASPLLAMDNVILTPHVAGLTEEASERMAIASVENAMGFLDGTIDTDLIVNRDAANV